MDADAGTQIGSHWMLLATVGGGFVGVFMFLKLLLNAIDARSDERHRLFWSNGGGDLLSEKVESGVLRALQKHQIECPHSQRVDALEERIITLERRD
jgi:hypothetical protein